MSNKQYLEQRLREHVHELGFRTLIEYNHWCGAHGFSLSVNKPVAQFEKERKLVKDLKAISKLYRHNVSVTPKKAIEMIRDGIINIPNEIYKKVADIYYKDLNVDSVEYLNFIEYLERVSDLFEDDKYIRPIANIVMKKDKWIRDYREWKPKSHNSGRQFASLLRYMFVKYEVPLFFDKAWFYTDHNLNMYLNWYISVGQGMNVMKCDGFLLHFPMTKKMAHYFMRAPDEYDFSMANRYAQIKSLGGSDRLVNTLMKVTKFVARVDRDFIPSLIKFFVDNPMLDMVQIGPIIDYIWKCKYEGQREYVDGRVIMRDPEQPNFSMNGRTVDTLLAQMERWHRQLGKEKKGDLVWEHSRFADFELSEGSGENQKIYKIVQLLNAKELSAEGRYMKHCVASYASSCYHGSVSIWSMIVEIPKRLEIEKLVTIEVKHSNRQICQIRGMYNRMPTQKEMQIINRWAVRESLSVNC